MEGGETGDLLVVVQEAVGSNPISHPIPFTQLSLIETSRFGIICVGVTSVSLGFRVYLATVRLRGDSGRAGLTLWMSAYSHKRTWHDSRVNLRGELSRHLCR